MSKAYQCDNCFECFPGGPACEFGHREICPSCLRGLKALGVIDPFVKAANTASAEKPINWVHCDCPMYRR